MNGSSTNSLKPGQPARRARHWCGRSAEAGDRYGELMAATALITAPLVLAFLAAQRRFIEGTSLGALKG